MQPLVVDTGCSEGFFFCTANVWRVAVKINALNFVLSKDSAQLAGIQGRHVLLDALSPLLILLVMVRRRPNQR